MREHSAHRPRNHGETVATTIRYPRRTHAAHTRDQPARSLPEIPSRRASGAPTASTALVLVVCGLLLVAAITAGVWVGSVGLSPGSVWTVIWDHVTGHPRNTTSDAIVWELRLPRVLLAAVVGAALTTAGTVVQVLVRNALADPFLLGVSSGASVGATSVLLFGVFSGLGLWALSTGAILGALVAMVLVFLVARQGGSLAPLQLTLCGVVLAGLFESITSFLIFRGNPQATQSVLFWLLGSFGNAAWSQLPGPALGLGLAAVYLMAQARALNALAMGPDAATSLGVNVNALRRDLFLVTSLIAGLSVAVSGVIGFVGLVIPHIVRLLVGSDHRRTLPVGALVGASFMVLSDLLARTVVAPQEMPIGVITAIIGAPTLIVLIRRRTYMYGGTG